MKIFNFLSPQTTKFFKRQEDIFIHLEKLKILYSGQKILIPSFICSEVIHTLLRINIDLVFYQLDNDLNLNLSQIERIIQDNKIDFFYVYRSFNNNKSISMINSFIKKGDISLIIDNAHFVKVSGDYPKFEFPVNKNIFLLELFSPRKYFRLGEGAMLRINNKIIYTYTELKNIVFFIDKFKRSILIRRFFNKSIIKIIYRFLKHNFKNNNSSIKDPSPRKIDGVSIISHYYYASYENTYHLKSFKFYKKYLALFKNNFTSQDKIIKESSIFWLLPINKNKKMKNMLEFLKDSSLNPFMQWPDKHKFLSNDDLILRDKFIFFRIDSLSCNSFFYKYISKIYNRFID